MVKSSPKKGNLKTEFDEAALFEGDGPTEQPLSKEFSKQESTLDLMLSDAKLTMPLLKKDAKFIMDQAQILLYDMGYKIDYRGVKAYDDPGVKSKKTAQHKVSSEKLGFYSQNLDYARASLKVFLKENKCQTEDQVKKDAIIRIAALCAYIEYAAENKIKLPSGGRLTMDINDRYYNPTSTGCRDFKCYVATPLKNSDRPYHIAELMIRHGNFEFAIENKKNASPYGTSHKAYEKKRFLEGLNKKKTIPVQSRKVIGRMSGALKDLHKKWSDEYMLDKVPEYKKKFKKHLDNGLKQQQQRNMDLQ